jgi:hypothetical protein
MTFNAIDSLFGVMNVLGISVIESSWLEPKPKLMLGAAAPVSDEFREEFNQWLLAKFGREAPQIITTPQGIFAGPSVVAALRNHRRIE